MSYNIPRILFELKRPKAYSLYIIQSEVKYIDDGNGRYIRVRTALFARARARRVFPRCYGSPAADDLGRQRKGTANKRNKTAKKNNEKKKRPPKPLDDFSPAAKRVYFAIDTRTETRTTCGRPYKHARTTHTYTCIVYAFIPFEMRINLCVYKRARPGSVSLSRPRAVVAESSPIRKSRTLRVRINIHTYVYVCTYKQTDLSGEGDSRVCVFETMLLFVLFCPRTQCELERNSYVTR